MAGPALIEPSLEAKREAIAALTRLGKLVSLASIIPGFGTYATAIEVAIAVLTLAVATAEPTPQEEIEDAQRLNPLGME